MQTMGENRDLTLPAQKSGTTQQRQSNMQQVHGLLASIYINTHGYMGVSENSVPLNPMVNDHYPYEKWLFHWEYTLFSDKPT